jgi:hypothetical protein
MIEQGHDIPEAKPRGQRVDGWLVDLEIDVEHRNWHANPGRSRLSGQFDDDPDVEAPVNGASGYESLEEPWTTGVAGDIRLVIDREPDSAGFDRHPVPGAEQSSLVRRESDQHSPMFAGDDPLHSCPGAIKDGGGIAYAGQELDGLVRCSIRMSNRSSRLEVVGYPAIGSIPLTHSEHHPSLPRQHSLHTPIVDDLVGPRRAHLRGNTDCD